jgi:hypothetical protein
MGKEREENTRNMKENIIIRIACSGKILPNILYFFEYNCESLQKAFVIVNRPKYILIFSGLI